MDSAMWSGLDCTLPSEWLCFWCTLATRDGALREIWGVYMYIDMFLRVYIYIICVYIYIYIYYIYIVAVYNARCVLWYISQTLSILLICIYIFHMYILIYINYIHIGYHQKGLCKGCVLEWNIAQNLQKRKRSFKTKANLTTKVCW